MEIKQTTTVSLQNVCPKCMANVLVQDSISVLRKKSIAARFLAMPF
jgi:hypothetical protein